MADVIAFIQWDSYADGINGSGFFKAEPLTFSSRQERLHKLGIRENLWLVSRCPDDGQHYFVAVLRVAELRRNPLDSSLAKSYGEFSIVADPSRSYDFGRKFPGEGLLRALQFESGTPIKFGASIGQSLQTIRVLSTADERALEVAFDRLVVGDTAALESPFGLWTKCDGVFAEYFWENWQAKQQPLAFLLYDSPPAIPEGAPVFIHSQKNLRLLAMFRGSQYVTGYKPTTDAVERLAERERIWTRFQAATINPPTKTEFDKFWDSQHGIRSLFLMDNLVEVPVELQFKSYGRALEWGYPMGVGYRYLTLSQCLLLLRASAIADPVRECFMETLLTASALTTSVHTRKDDAAN